MKTIPTIAAALITGVVIGGGAIHVVERGGPGETTDPLSERVDRAVVPVVRVVTNTVVRTVTNTSFSVSSADANLMQGEITRLSASLAQSEAKLNEIEEARAAAQQEREERRKSWQERAEKMREEDPEGYAAILKRREEIQARMTDSVTDKTTFLKNLDTKNMSESEKANHDEILARIESTWDIINSTMGTGESPSGEQRELLRENYRVLNDLYATERDYVLRQIGTGLGLKEQEAADFSLYIKEIMELTSPRTGGMRGMSMGGGGGRRGDR